MMDKIMKQIATGTLENNAQAKTIELVQLPTKHVRLVYCKSM